MRSRPRGRGDLVRLLTSDVRDSFKRRALFLLIVPSAYFNPLYWTNDVGHYHGTNFLKDLPTDLLRYVAELVIEFCVALTPLHCDRPEHHTAGGGGIIVFWSVLDRYHDVLVFYNNCIVELLGLLPPDEGEKLFPLFSLNDISTFSGLEESSGYHPFRYLLRAEKVGERWKREADAAMRKIVENELGGKARPRGPWENALNCYAQAIQEQLYDKLTYSVELFASQMQFLMDNRAHSDLLLIDGRRVIRVFNLLPGDAYKELRHTLSRYAVLESEGKLWGFSLSDKETFQAVHAMLEEFGEDDRELADRLEALMADRRRAVAEDAARRNEKELEEFSILAAMK